MFSLFWAMASGGFCGDLEVRGKIRDANTHRPVTGVNVILEDGGYVSFSDAAGRFFVSARDSGSMVTFHHIAYDTLRLPVSAILKSPTIEMQGRLLSIAVIEVEGQARRPEIRKDLPLLFSRIEARSFEMKGYIDAGDLLRSDHAIQVDETIDGKKTVSIRGGDPDEVTVLFNGIPMNSSLDHVFDMSLIDLEEIERLEVIKGSHSALYGGEAFSGMINIVPAVNPGYRLRFQQRIGSYDAGRWGLNLHQRVGRLNGGYSIRRSGARRSYAGGELLENLAGHHSASLHYAFDDAAGSSLNAFFVRSDLDYRNEQNLESLENLSQMLTAGFNGSLAGIKSLRLVAGYQWLDEEQFLNSGTATANAFQNRRVDQRTVHLHSEKMLRVQLLDLLLAYQFRRSRLDYQDLRLFPGVAAEGVEAVQFIRRRHGLAAIAKFHAPSGSPVISILDFDVSLRHDRLTDSPSDIRYLNNRTSGIPVVENDWQETMLNMSTRLAGGRKDLAFNGYLAVGSNFKFPTLFQQISLPDTIAATPAATPPRLAPERNQAVEIGLEISRELRGSGLWGWQINANYFRNTFEDKIRSFSIPGLPAAFYDNVADAGSSGLEALGRLYFAGKKVTLSGGISRFFFSDRLTFPFRSENKRTLHLNIDHAGYNLQFFAFEESDQKGVFRSADAGFTSATLPEFANIDLHFSKIFEWRQLKYIFNTSLRNILNDDVVLEGLALRDRRYYVSAGIQF